MELKSSVLCVPSRNTGQGANCHGKLNLSKGRRRETKFSQYSQEYQEKRVKVRRVMAARLEASRSIPGLDEGGRKPAGGLKTF